MPAGLGEPVFDKLEADLAKAHDEPARDQGLRDRQRLRRHAAARLRAQRRLRDGARERCTPTTNRSGGIQGGITNGEPIFFRIAFKPTATHFEGQQTVTRAGEATELHARGRHDPCVLPRAVPMVEAMAALVLAITRCGRV